MDGLAFFFSFHTRIIFYYNIFIRIILLLLCRHNKRYLYAKVTDQVLITFRSLMFSGTLII